jgi:hypothetical protein
MVAGFDRLLTRFERGEISRRELLGTLCSLAGATSATAAEPMAGAVKQLNHVTVFVQDVGKSVEFYQRLFGMPLRTRQDPGVNLSAGSGFFGIYPAQNRRRGIDHGGVGPLGDRDPK